MSGNSFISQNPFRVISVLSNSGAKEIKKNLSKLKLLQKSVRVLLFNMILTS